MVARFCYWTIDIFDKVLKGSSCYNSILDFKYNEAIAFSMGELDDQILLLFQLPLHIMVSPKLITYFLEQIWNL